MNAPQTTSVVNLISAQPAKAPASSVASANGQSFANILGSQQAKPVTESRSPAASTPPAQPSANASQGASGSSQQASSSNSAQPTSSASSTQQGASGSESTAAQASGQAENASGANSNAPANANGSAQKETSTESSDLIAANPTAMAMSDLAAAVAQVFMARNTSDNTARTENDRAPLAGGIAPESTELQLDNASPGKQGLGAAQLDDFSLQAGQRALAGANLTAANQRAATDANLTAIQRAAANPTKGNEQQADLANSSSGKTSADARTVKDPVLATPAAQDSPSEKSAASLASLNQRADSLDREARLNPNARNTLDKTTSNNAREPDNDSDARIFSTLSESDRANETRLKAGITAANNPFNRDAGLPLAAASTPLTEASIGLAPANLNFAPGAMAAPMVSTPLGHPQWGNDFSQQVAGISQNLKNGLQTIEMRLDPPDLGPIRISLTLSDGVAQAMFISPHANVRNAVENALPQLQQQLAQAGISLGQTSVSDQGQTGQQAGENGPSGARGNNSLASAGVVAENALPAPQARPQSAHNGQINTFA